MAVRVVRRAWPYLLLLAVALGHIVYLAHTTGRWIVDDAFVSFRYVENWVDGRGLVFNVGERVEGYSNFLWIVLLAPFYAAGLSTPVVAQWLGILLTLCSVGLMVAIGTELCDRKCGFALGALYALNHSLMSWSFGGLELPLFLFVTLLGLYLLAGRRSAWGLLPMAAAALTRPDGLLMLVAGLAFVWAPRGPVAASRARAAATIAALAAVGGHTAFRFAYYGELLPNTFHAKVGFHVGQLARGYDYLRDAASRYLVLLPLALLLPAARGPRAARRLLLALGCAYAAFVVYSGGDPHPGYRLALPLLPLGWIAIGMVLRTARVRARAAALGLWVVLFVNDLWQELPLLPEGRAFAHFRTDKVAVCGARIGLWLATNAPEGAVVATNTGGAIPYFAKRQVVIDMLGLTDATVARANRDVGTGYVGHEAHDSRYVLSRKPDYIFLCFACNTMGPCLASDKELVADPQFKEGYEPHRAVYLGQRFRYYTPKKPAAARAGAAPSGGQEPPKASTAAARRH